MLSKFQGAVVVTIVATIFLAWRPTVTQAAVRYQDHDHDHDEESVLHGSMEDLNSTLRRINRLLKEPQEISDVVELVVAMELNVLEAKAEIPPRAATLEGEARDAFVLGFRRDMIKLLVTLTELELACLDGQTDAAQEIVKRLVNHRNASHELYQDE